MSYKRRHNLFRVDKYCFWCRVEMVLDIPEWTKQPLNFATLDHVYHKGHPLRKKFRNLVVLACRRCNKDREWIFRTIYRDRETRAEWNNRNNVVKFPRILIDEDLDKRLNIIIKEYYNKLKTS